MYNDIYLNSRTENEKYLQELNLIIKMLLEKTLNFFNKPFKVYYENVTKMDLDYSEYYSFVECIIYYSDKTALEKFLKTIDKSKIDTQFRVGYTDGRKQTMLTTCFFRENLPEKFEKAKILINNGANIETPFTTNRGNEKYRSILDYIIKRFQFTNEFEYEFKNLNFDPKDEGNKKEILKNLEKLKTKDPKHNEKIENAKKELEKFIKEKLKYLKNQKKAKISDF